MHLNRPLTMGKLTERFKGLYANLQSSNCAVLVQEGAPGVQPAV